MAVVRSRAARVELGLGFLCRFRRLTRCSWHLNGMGLRTSFESAAGERKAA